MNVSLSRETVSLPPYGGNGSLTVLSGEHFANGAKVQTEWPDIEPDYAARCLKVFVELLSPLTNGANDVVSSDAIVWDYSDVIPRGRTKSGIQYFDYARQFDPLYSTIVRAEEQMVHDCAEHFKFQLSHHRLPFISYGPGSGHAVLSKDVVLMQALNSPSCDLLDIETLVASKAAKAVESQIDNIPVRSHNLNFMKDYPSGINQPSFGALLGGTMGQFDMRQFFNQFYQSTEGQGVLFFTLNGDRDRPEYAYFGPHFKEFKINTWHLLKSAARDPGFKANNAFYIPECDNDTRAVKHKYFFKEMAVLVTGEERIVIPRGSAVVTGVSKRPNRAIVEAESSGTGMHLAEYFNDPATKMCGYLMVGDRFPYNIG